MTRKPVERTAAKRLFGLSGNICAFPNCTKRMVESDGNIAGQICHIEAAEEGGERYNYMQSDNERNAVENLILFCKKHHEVTDDVNKYTVDALKKMKAGHEAKHSGELLDVSDDIVDKFMEKIDKQQNNVNNSSGTIIAPQGGNVYIQGMTISDGISLFKELFKENMVKLQNAAAKVAEARVSELYDSFTKHAAAANLTEEEFGRFAEPEAQAALTAAIKTGALREEPLLREVLAGLLVKKLRHDRDDYKRLILTETISTIGKLTVNHIRILTLIFVVTYVEFAKSENWEVMNANFKRRWKPFMDVKIGLSNIQHLVYAGCGILNSLGQTSPHEVLQKNYPRLFYSPILLNEEPVLSKEAQEVIQKHAVRQGEGYLFDEIALQDIYSFLSAKSVPETILVEVAQRVVAHRQDGRRYTIENSPIGGELLNMWDTTPLRHLTLTSVGIAIAVSFLEEVMGDKLDLNHWFG